MHVTDWYPTFVEAAGGVPKKDNLDGVSLMSSLSGKTTDAPRESVLLNTNPKISAIRSGKWKLIVRSRANGREISELYDLSTDISESKNILVDHSEQAKRLRQLLKKYAEEAVTPLKGGRDINAHVSWCETLVAVFLSYAVIPPSYIRTPAANLPRRRATGREPILDGSLSTRTRWPCAVVA